MGVLRKLFVLIKHLGGVAARPAVDPVQLRATAALIAVPTPATTVIPVIIVVIQGKRSLSATWRGNNHYTRGQQTPCPLVTHGSGDGLAKACRALRAVAAGGVP
jgi:hypothetical protein